MSANKELSLINEVFNTPAGKELLELWIHYHVFGVIQHEDVNVTHNRLGRRDFVTTIINCMGKEK